MPYGNGPVFHVRSDKFFRDFTIGLKGPIAIVFFQPFLKAAFFHSRYLTLQSLMSCSLLLNQWSKRTNRFFDLRMFFLNLYLAFLVGAIVSLFFKILMWYTVFSYCLRLMFATFTRLLQIWYSLIVCGLTSIYLILLIMVIKTIKITATKIKVTTNITIGCQYLLNKKAKLTYECQSLVVVFVCAVEL